jgi:hypothetical protein
VAQIAEQAMNVDSIAEFEEFAASDFHAAWPNLRRALQLMPADYLATLARTPGSPDTTTLHLKGYDVELLDRADRFLRLYQDGGGALVRDCHAEQDLVFYAATCERTDLVGLSAGRDLAIAASTAERIRVGECEAGRDLSLRFASTDWAVVGEYWGRGGQVKAGGKVQIGVYGAGEVAIAAKAPSFQVDVGQCADFRFRPTGKVEWKFEVNYRQSSGGIAIIELEGRESGVNLTGETAGVDSSVPVSQFAPASIHIEEPIAGRLAIRHVIR